MPCPYPLEASAPSCISYFCTVSTWTCCTCEAVRYHRQKPFHPAIGKFLALTLCTHFWYAVQKNSCCNYASCLLLQGAYLCLAPLYNVLGAVPKRFPLFVHALPYVALRLVSLAVSALLVHVPNSFAWQPFDELTPIDFWAHMADIPQVVAIHLGICG